MLHNVASIQPIIKNRPILASKVKNVFAATMQQHTVKKTVVCKGIGIHSGADVTLKIKPSAADTGFIFVRTDLTTHNRISARWDTVVDTSMCTKIANKEGASVSTIEHLMAAFRAVGIHNALIEIDGSEVPIMDGSSIEFIRAIQQSGGIKSLSKPLKQIRILKPIHVAQEKGQAWLLPANESRISIYFDGFGRFPTSWTFDYFPEEDDFTTLLSEARTFGFLEDGNKLRAMGLARGASLDNTVVIDEDQIMNDGGLRYEDEFVRHKILDAYGDLMLAGVRLIGHFHGHNSGHGLNNQILRALFDDLDAWTYV